MIFPAWFEAVVEIALIVAVTAAFGFAAALGWYRGTGPLAGVSGGLHAGLADNEAGVVTLQMNGNRAPRTIDGGPDIGEIVLFGGVLQGLAKDDWGRASPWPESVL